jgi:hypothetical protein
MSEYFFNHNEIVSPPCLCATVRVFVSSPPPYEIVSIYIAAFHVARLCQAHFSRETRWIMHHPFWSRRRLLTGFFSVVTPVGPHYTLMAKVFLVRKRPHRTTKRMAGRQVPFPHYHLVGTPNRA